MCYTGIYILLNITIDQFSKLQDIYLMKNNFIKQKN